MRSKRGVGYLNDIQGFPDPALYPDIAERTAGWWLCTQRSGMASPPAPVTSTRRRARRDCAVLRARVSALRRSGVAADRLILDPGMGFFLSPAPETSLHVLSNLQKLKSALGLPLLVSVSRKSFLGGHRWPSCKGSGSSEPCGGTSRDRQMAADYVRTHAPGDLRSAITFSETLREISQSRRQRPRVRSCLHSPSGRPLATPGQVPRRWAQTCWARQDQTAL
ncbi:Dihydropteroate synthase 1 [Achromobacter xylosoxidans]|uniref:dihydropteroate synthase n=1 Tax=Alcaligenes xylosoxydans xylosoxydans TaxID=85698 RepID=UPI0012A94B11|nr:hypothetical protein ACGI01_00390 [Achromobacter xylosoxidans]CUR71489.1 Dihydropteroate synthase 1 [Achromobacter xylosoxidans]